MNKTLPLLFLAAGLSVALAPSASAQTVTAANITTLSADKKAAAVTVKLTGTLTTTSNGDFRQLRDLCYQMQSLNLQTATCTAIPKNALHSRHNLRTVKLPTKLKTIGSQAFFACDSLEGTISIPSLTTSIGASCFAGCKKLQGVTFAKSGSLVNIGSYAFEGCESLSGTITIPTKMTNLRDGVFARCANLEGVALPDGLQQIGANTFSGCEKLTGEINLGKMVTRIGASAFAGCKSLETIAMPRALQQLGNAAFADCSSLTGTISFPSSLVSLGKGAFMNCSKIEEIVLPAELPEIKSATFAGCTGLKTVTVLAETPTAVSASAFAGVDCSQVQLLVPAGSENLYKAAAVWKDFNIGTISTGIETVSADATVSVKNGHIYIYGVGAGTTVELHNAQGQLLQSVTANGTAVLSVPRPDVYIVSFGGTSQKVNVTK